MRSLMIVSFLILSVVVLSVQSAMAVTILFHGSGVGPTDFADGAAFAHLQAGYGAANVTYMQGDLAAADGSSANGFDLLVISSTVPSGTVRGKYEDTTVGVVNWEAALFTTPPGEFQMSTGFEAFVETSITIVAPGHPLAAGLSGTVTVANALGRLSLGSGVFSPGVTLIGESPSTSGAYNIFAVDVGDALLGDGTPELPAIAASRRVSFFLHDATFDLLTPDGLKLFDAAIDWAGAGARIPEPSTFTLVSIGGFLGLLSLGIRRRRRRAA